MLYNEAFTDGIYFAEKRECPGFSNEDVKQHWETCLGRDVLKPDPPYEELRATNKELLEVLERLVFDWNSNDDYERLDNCSDLSDIYDDAKAAIAKATK